METKRLRTIQEPYRLERLLEAYITRTNVVPKDAYQIRDPNAVVSPLRRIAIEAGAQGQVWACWEYGTQQWVFTAEMCLPQSRERGTPVLRINRYDDQGKLIETGEWLLDSDGIWRRGTE